MELYPIASTIVKWSDYSTLVNLYFVNKLYKALVKVQLTQGDWEAISKVKNLPIAFIKDYQDFLNFRYVCIHTKLDEPYLEDFIQRLNWVSTSTFQQLSENFIRKYQHKVFWFAISKHQTLTKNFIDEFKGNLNQAMIKKYQTINE